MDKNVSILVTGGTGFLGSAVCRCLRKKKYKNVTAIGSKDYDLRKLKDVKKAVAGRDVIIHLAADVGGIGYNQQNPGSLFYNNLIMGVNLIEEARKAEVKKFVAIGTVCAYPKIIPIPFKEENLWDGYPEETNAPYGLAKKMLLVQSQAYRQQYNFNSIYLLPVNLYGPADNFDPFSAHVIPDLIRKIHAAKVSKKEEVVLWGTGTPTREFLFVDDAAEGIVLAMENYNGHEPVNLGSSFEISVKDLATKIKDIIGYKGDLRFDTTKPDGQPRRKLNVQKAKKYFGFVSKVSFDKGLQKTINWYKKNWKNLSEEFKPKISIITPSYNQGHLIEQTILSVMNQNYLNKEHIIVDGGSTDNTSEILKKYKDNITYISEKDRGQTDAINKGIKMATGDIIAYLNSDDVYEPNAFKAVMEEFEKNPKCKWIYGKIKIIDDNGKVIPARKPITFYRDWLSKKFSYKKLLVINFIAQPAVFFRKELIKEFGYFDETLRYTMDYDYWLRIGKKYKPMYINKILARFRIHTASKGNTSHIKQFKEDLQVSRKYNKNTLLHLIHKLNNQLIISVYNVMNRH